MTVPTGDNSDLPSEQGSETPGCAITDRAAYAETLAVPEEPAAEAPIPKNIEIPGKMSHLGRASAMMSR